MSLCSNRNARYVSVCALEKVSSISERRNLGENEALPSSDASSHAISSCSGSTPSSVGSVSMIAAYSLRMSAVSTSFPLYEPRLMCTAFWPTEYFEPLASTSWIRAPPFALYSTPVTIPRTAPAAPLVFGSCGLG